MSTEEVNALRREVLRQRAELERIGETPLGATGILLEAGRQLVEALPARAPQPRTGTMAEAWLSMMQLTNSETMAHVLFELMADARGVNNQGNLVRTDLEIAYDAFRAGRRQQLRDMYEKVPANQLAAMMMQYTSGLAAAEAHPIRQLLYLLRRMAAAADKPFPGMRDFLRLYMNASSRPKITLDRVDEPWRALVKVVHTLLELGMSE